MTRRGAPTLDEVVTCRRCPRPGCPADHHDIDRVSSEVAWCLVCGHYYELEEYDPCEEQ